jgi:aspartate kinase
MNLTVWNHCFFGGTQVSQVASANEPITVLKIGGSILKNARAYRRAAQFLRTRQLATPQERLVIVVSAQEGVTDTLERTARRIVPEPDPKSVDLLWSTGEILSVALLALHLQALGASAVALNIHQSGLRLQREENIQERLPRDLPFLRGALRECSITIVPGFLAVDSAQTIVSLGRGGSDLTAVLLAAGLGACRCELIKDVPGYFTADPHRERGASHVPFLTFKEALRMAEDGCDLVQRQAIEAAMNQGLPLVIRCLNDAAPSSRIATEREVAGDNARIPNVATA